MTWFALKLLIVIAASDWRLFALHITLSAVPVDVGLARKRFKISDKRLIILHRDSEWKAEIPDAKVAICLKQG